MEPGSPVAEQGDRGSMEIGGLRPLMNILTSFFKINGHNILWLL